VASGRTHVAMPSNSIVLRDKLESLRPAKRRKIERQIIQPKPQAGLHIARSRTTLQNGIPSPLPNSGPSARTSRKVKTTGRVFSNGQIGKDVSPQPFKATEQLENVLRYFVFPHINAALDQYSHFLTNTMRSEIGTEVRNKLTKFPLCCILNNSRSLDSS
jgi:hypothetical protein